MGIRSTQRITRNEAIERICLIQGLVSSKNYIGLEKESFEPDLKPRDFVDDFTDHVDCSMIRSYTNDMLEEYMDMPFFRYSMFDNYIVIDEM